MRLAKPAIAPTDRSMPAVMMTKVSPIARIAIIEPCRSRFSILVAVQNVLVASDRASHMSASSPTRVRLRRTPIAAPLLLAGGTFRTLIRLLSRFLFLVSCADRLGQDFLVRCVLEMVARGDGAAAKHVQSIGELVNLRQI